jgi:Fe-S-cluster containining protein
MLSPAEYERNRRAMKLKAMVKPRSYPQIIHGRAFMLGADGHQRLGSAPPMEIPSHHGFYVLIADCGNLEAPQDGRISRYCTVYDNRPAACRSFEVGSQACKTARAAAGLDGHGALPDELRHDPEEMRQWFNQNE